MISTILTDICFRHDFRLIIYLNIKQNGIIKLIFITVQRVSPLTRDNLREHRVPELYLDELLLGELDLVPELGAGADQLLLGGEEGTEGGQLGLAQVPQQTGLDLAAVGSSLH